MNFKIRWTLILIGISMIFTGSGCTDFLRGKNQKKEVLKIQIVDAECAVDFKFHLQQVIRSESKDQDIHLVFDCVDQYLAQFQNKVNGEVTPDIYDVQDVHYITNRFFKDLNLSQEAIAQIFKLKKALVGGEAHLVSKAEMQVLRSFLKILKKEVLALHPYFKFLGYQTPENQKTVSEEQIRSAIQQLRLSSENILQSIQLVDSGYTYKMAKEMILSLGLMQSNQDLLQDLDQVRRLILGREELNTLGDYRIAFNSHIDFYQMYLLAIHGHIVFEMQSLGSTKKAALYVDEIVSVLKNSFQYQKTKKIHLQDLDGVLSVILQKKILPFKVKFETFRDFYKIALKRLFKHHNSEYINATQFETYRHEAELFKLEIKFLETLSEKTSYTSEEVQKKFSQFITDKSYGLLPEDLSSEQKKYLITALIDLNYDFYTQYPLVIKNRKFFVSSEARLVGVKPLDLLHSFYIRTLARQLLMGWGNAQSVSQLLKSQINKDQLIQFMTDFSDFGIELKLNDPRSKNNGSKNFLEADILGFHSDGNNMMSMLETIEYLHYLVAEGAWAVNEIQADLKAQQCQLPELDVFGLPYSPDRCFYELMKHNYSKYFVNKPGLVKFLSRLTSDEFYKYYSLLMDVARFEMSNRGLKVETVDLQSFVVISTYVEGLLSKYDQNNNGSLSAEEIRLGYPKFKTFATEYSQQSAAESLEKWDSTFNYCRWFYSKEDLIRESFVFMVLNNGITPSMADVNYVSCAVNGLFTFKNEVDRKTIINTFFVLKTVLASEK